MIKQLRVAFDHTTSKLSYAKRKELFDALNWHGVESLYGPAPVPWTGTDLGFKRSAATVSSRS